MTSTGRHDVSPEDGGLTFQRRWWTLGVLLAALLVIGVDRSGRCPGGSGRSRGRRGRPPQVDPAVPAHRRRRPREVVSAVTEIFPGRHTAVLDQPLALFLVGMRIHRPLQVRTWWPAFTAMSRMLRQLQADPELGLLAATLTYTPHPVLIQYWRSVDHLQRFARDPALAHRPAWRSFNQLTAGSSDALGLWHEVYPVAPGSTTSLYRNMPRIGLAAAAGHAPLAPRGSTTSA